ncbi:C4-dicarboxylate TRAP transporter substrate-binding protein [Microvirga splendida]|uniref:C4-dicarboxylate TRAP transporter substrate-binding protein n=1 Tax=Microvirga splendida TaxID=2795727 RepID=A0ABS0Y745_9HYPH|nr:C4-dicarboxylate TRAP transporter substrate-binding protein [Microvirga splendida]MBJ6128128.1 C4-dicarboxylate TRAP transporter substrate-binding protein [Microvirga splendida]
MPTKFSRNATRGVALAAGVGLFSSAALAENYSFSTWLEPNHPITLAAHVPWAKAVSERTGGAVNFEIYMAGALLPAKGTMQGVADGVAQGGFHTATYTPSELPLWNAIGDLSFKHPDPMVAAFAATEFGLMNPAGNSDWAKNDVIYLGSYSTPVYHFICREEVKTLADLRGKRVRMPGGAWARFGETIGTVSVNVPSSEIYTAFERGTVDCTASDVTHLTAGATLMGVTKSINTLTMGPFFAGATWIFNKDFWSELKPDQRKIIFEESARALARLQISYDELVQKNLDAAKAAGKAIIPPPADLQQSYDKFVADGIGGMADIGKRAGIQTFDKSVQELSSLMQKWEGLLAKANRKSEDELTQLLRREIYDKLDASKYGLN